ncbi:hypothetical protein [Photobacterium sp. 1_MG-2023]|uniref:hypothetical protein n=1 Tax=Photobacterium sp. 1_MG-2023 TaxID=3062646 RepID=UPI0026E18298|nr:hypothetical protein [Photobacterium sp. 1_MG-2023]MDO6708965.1 hypothetical protein [Photobacterium sp. 1_MG-2023]
MVRISIKILFYIMCLLLLQGCPKYEEFVIFNNTGNDLSVLLKDSVVNLPRDEFLIIDKDILGRMKWEEYRGVSFPTLQLFKRGVTMTYIFGRRSSGIPEEYVKDVSGSFFSVSKRQFYFQIEKDNNMYLRFPSESIVDIQKIKQPAGYPISPGS